MLEAAAENTYARSVTTTPSEYWKSRTSTISINRYTEGVRGTVKVYEVFKTLSELVLPPRAPRGDPRNLERVRAIIKALRAKKTS